jgi:hypothetical protein
MILVVCPFWRGEEMEAGARSQERVRTIACDGSSQLWCQAQQDTAEMRDNPLPALRVREGRWGKNFRVEAWSKYWSEHALAYKVNRELVTSGFGRLAQRTADCGVENKYQMLQRIRMDEYLVRLPHLGSGNQRWISTHLGAARQIGTA